MQLNIYAWMIEQLGRPKIERIALVYIDNNGATQCSRCKTPVDADLFGGMSCPSCGSQPRDPHFGVKTIEVEKMPAEEIGRIFRDRKTILEMAFETNQPPEGEPGWLCKWCPHECPFRQE
jgi:hypothetical protein